MLDPASLNFDRYLTLVSARQRVVASNIANADTPGYKTKDIDFESELRSSISGSSALPTEVPGLTVKNDGNNVDLDREARLLAENALRFNIASNLIHSKLKSMHLAISGGTASS